jgi:hypothetical protein
LRACDLGLRADFRREDFAVFGARGFCGDRRVARLLDFELGSREGIRLYLLRGPSVAASVPQCIEDPAVEAAQNVAHEVECAIGEEIRAVNISDPLREEARAIHVPNVICWR